MEDKKVGAFEVKAGALYGPKTYMKEQGNTKLEEILAGDSVVFNYGIKQHPDLATALLVAMQTDYAAWKGMQTLPL